MIGFRPPSTTRRPVYSVTGEKLCYLVSGPDGEYATDLEGRKLAKVAGWKRDIGKLDATQVAASGLLVSPGEQWEQ